MDEVKDFFKELKERASSPLIASFLVSWIIINWDIIIAVFFSNNGSVISGRYVFIYNTVKDHYTIWEMGILPLICASVYVGVYPLIKRATKAYSAWQSALSEQEVLKITKDKAVSLDSYLKMVEAQKESRNRLTELINTHKDTEDKNIELQGKVDNLTLELMETTKNHEQKLNETVENHGYEKTSLFSELYDMRAFANTSNYYREWQSYDASNINIGTWNFSGDDLHIVEYGNTSHYKILHFLMNEQFKIISFFLTEQSLGQQNGEVLHLVFEVQDYTAIHTTTGSFRRASLRHR